MDEINDHGVHGLDAFAPAAGCVGKLAPFQDLTFLAYCLRDPFELAGEAPVQVGDVVESLGDFAIYTCEIHREADSKIPFAEGA